VGADALSRAISSRAEWLWLLTSDGRPDDTALERLIGAARPAGEPRASVVAGILVDPANQPVHDAFPAFKYSDDEATVRLVGHALLPIRSAPFVNCLVRRSCFLEHGSPDTRSFGRYAPVAWTARVLADAPGYFAPLSVARLTAPIRPSSRWAALAEAPSTIRMARSGAWTRGESGRAFGQLITGGLTRAALVVQPSLPD
jgi:hypothetical protein